jgi:hypothetical protein
MGASGKEKLFSFLERRIYSKAHLAVEAYKRQNSNRLLNEADPHPKVEKDRHGNPVIPSREAYSQYFETMAAKYIQDQICRCQERWQQLTDDPKHRAERQAITNELAAAKDALSAQPDGVHPVLDALFQNKD